MGKIKKTHLNEKVESTLPQEIKDEVIEMYLNSHIKILAISQKLNSKYPEITVEEIYKILEEYKQNEKKEVYRGRKNLVTEEISKRIYELKEEGNSEGLIIKQIKEEFGVYISKVTMNTVIKNMYDELNKKRPSSIRKITDVSEDISIEKIKYLRKQGMSYTNIVGYFDERGQKVPIAYIIKICKEMNYNENNNDIEINNNKRKEIKINVLQNDFVEYTNVNEKKLAGFKKYLKEESKDIIKSAFKELMNKKHATKEQIEVLINFYDIDINIFELLEEEKEK